MRIVKGRAIGILTEENRALDRQIALCDEQQRKVSAIVLEGMEGVARTKMQSKIRAQSAVVRSHRRVFTALKGANNTNISAVRRLPETGPGVLDTSVAQARIYKATAEIQRLERELAARVSAARRTNSQIDAARRRVQPGQPFPPLKPINIAAIEAYYRALINAQKEIIRVNREIIRKAEDYNRISAVIYGGVGLDTIAASTNSVNSYLSTGQWGNLSWRDKERFGKFVAGVLIASVSVRGKVGRLFKDYLDGKLKIEGQAKEFPLIGNAVKGRLGAWSAKLEPYGEYKETDDDKGGASIGIKGKVEASAASLEAEGNWGLLHADGNIKALTGAATGKLGASLYKNGKFDPAVEAEIKGEASVVSGEINTKIGGDALDGHLKGEGALLTASAKASVGYTKEDGLKAEAGAEAYCAKGKISGGINILGIKIDVGLEGGAGGAGAKAGGSVSGTKATGKIGAGLGLGAGAEVSIDWSGFSKGLDSAVAGIKSWWK